MNTIWIAVGALTLLGLVFGAILVMPPADSRLKMIRLLKNRCDFAAEPVWSVRLSRLPPLRRSRGSPGEKINRCAPGGEAVMLKIAELLNVEPQPCDGEEQQAAPVRMLAVIDENNCIGCTKCIQACPVDAIVGATRAMHTVMSDLCTGCNLCVDPCPTHCIELRPVNETPDSWKWDLNTIPVRIIPVEQHA